MKRDEILKTASDCICGDRQRDYGDPANNFAMIANLWNDYLGLEHSKITARDVGLMMGLVKIARIKTGSGTDDCYVDLAGYAAIAGEISGRGAENQTSSCEMNLREILMQIYPFNIPFAIYHYRQKVYVCHGSCHPAAIPFPTEAPGSWVYNNEKAWFYSTSMLVFPIHAGAEFGYFVMRREDVNRVPISVLTDMLPRLSGCLPEMEVKKT